MPIDPSWSSEDEYVESLLAFVSTSELFRNLCGGVHILDFLTRKPDLYSWILPEPWRIWFELVDIADVLDLLLREDLYPLIPLQGKCDESHAKWRGYPLPPVSLVNYINRIRRHSLQRDLKQRNKDTEHQVESLPKHIAVGMKPKKIHEVTQFAAFVDDLSNHILQEQSDLPCHGTSDRRPNAFLSLSRESKLVIVDFGSGQNYLGRTLACPPYKKEVIAIEQRHHNVEGARGMDVSAKLSEKVKRVVNKKEWKAHWLAGRSKEGEYKSDVVDAITGLNPASEKEIRDIESRVPQLAFHDPDKDSDRSLTSKAEQHTNSGTNGARSISPTRTETSSNHDLGSQRQEPSTTTGSIQYVEKELSSGDLKDIFVASSVPSLVVSIHSCGNLTHHGLRSLILNSSVYAVALIGCCYNLLTERLGKPTYKLPTLRSNHPRLDATSSACDSHGFPMSSKLEKYTYSISQQCDSAGRKIHDLNGEYQDFDTTGKGVRLNITARMMAVQAPHNWGPKDSDDFFTRHYYRALLQKILLDLRVVTMITSSSTEQADGFEIAGGTLTGKNAAGRPLIIGHLRKSCFTSFASYVIGAVQKLIADPIDGGGIRQKTQCLFEDDGNLIRRYEQDYQYAKKQLSVIWSLMAFSATVVESTILVDRWLWLKEQHEVQDAWIEAVFDYKQSPRNMVVVGVKKQNHKNDQT